MSSVWGGRALLPLIQVDLRETIPSVTLDAGNSFCCDEAVTGLCNATLTLSACSPKKGMTIAPQTKNSCFFKLINYLLMGISIL